MELLNTRAQPVHSQAIESLRLRSSCYQKTYLTYHSLEIIEGLH